MYVLCSSVILCAVCILGTSKCYTQEPLIPHTPTPPPLLLLFHHISSNRPLFDSQLWSLPYVNANLQCMVIEAIFQHIYVLKRMCVVNDGSVCCVRTCDNVET